MSKHCLFIGWNRPVAGRETNAIELFTTTVKFFQSKVGKDIDSFEPVMLSVHGGDMNGFFLLRGDAEKMDKMRQQDDFMEVVSQIAYNLEASASSRAGSATRSSGR